MNLIWSDNLQDHCLVFVALCRHKRGLFGLFWTADAGNKRRCNLATGWCRTIGGLKKKKKWQNWQWMIITNSVCACVCPIGLALPTCLFCRCHDDSYHTRPTPYGCYSNVPLFLFGWCRWARCICQLVRTGGLWEWLCFCVCVCVSVSEKIQTKNTEPSGHRTNQKNTVDCTAELWVLQESDETIDSSWPASTSVQPVSIMRPRQRKSMTVTVLRNRPVVNYLHLDIRPVCTWTTTQDSLFLLKWHKNKRDSLFWMWSIGAFGFHSTSSLKMCCALRSFCVSGFL